MVKEPKIKEISILVYRKYTEDYNSMGYRFGISVDVEGCNPRDSWYQGMLFLKKRMEEEEKIIKEKFRLLAEKKGKSKNLVLTEIPKKKKVKYVGVKGKEKIEVKTGAYMSKSVNDETYSLHDILEMEFGVSVEELKREMEETESSIIKVKEILNTSKKAVQVKLFDGRDVWLARSTIYLGNDAENWDKGVEQYLMVSDWLLKRNNINNINKDLYNV